MINRISDILLLVFLLIFSNGLHAQKRYWVFFSDKSGVEFNPYTYFDPSTIQRRLEKHIPLVQFSDLPVRKDYLEGIQNITGKPGTVSRWYNAASVSTDEKNLRKISELHYVIRIEEIQTFSVSADADFDSEIKIKDDQLRILQINTLGVKYFEEKGIDGAGVRIAVFDGGFPGVDTSTMFQHLRESGRIIATWDFVKGREFVYGYSSHGTSVLTCIAGKIDDKKFGLAPGAEFLLARTEVTREVFSEEENWLAAMEWADKNGADIISSSLGYTFNRYFPKNMDGKSTLVTRSANLAASKGILVINAAGNDGDKKWEVIGAPADADSVLSIGGVSPESGYHIDFSSFGPTYDGRMKPNLVAFGKVTISNKRKIKQSYGTSFATPLVSGFAACVMQIHPEWNNMDVFREMEKSGHLYPYFDYAHGYGVPQASYFTVGKPVYMPTFKFAEDSGSLRIIPFKDKSESHAWPNGDTLAITDMEYAAELNSKEDQSEDSTRDKERNDDEEQIENMDEVAYEPHSEINVQFTNGYELDRSFFYFLIIRKDEKKIKRYAVVNMKSSEEFTIPLEELENGDRIVGYYKGFTKSYEYWEKGQ